MIVLGPRTTFLDGLYTVRNLYQRTHTVSCTANVGEASHPALAVVGAAAGRAFVLRVSVKETDEDGVEHPYDLTGMDLSALVTKHRGYDEAETTPTELDVDVEIPARMGLLKVTVAATDLTDPGSYSVEVVDMVAAGVPSEDPEVPDIPPSYASVCRFEMELKRP